MQKKMFSNYSSGLDCNRLLANTDAQCGSKLTSPKMFVVIGFERAS